MLARIRFLLKAGGRDVALLWYALRQPETPVSIKVCTALLALYVISPLDIIPDFVPVLGWLDDATLLTLGIPFLVKMIPAHIKRAAENKRKYRT